VCKLKLQALGGRIRPVLTVNKMDRCFPELQADGEEDILSCH
jgi:elongation factor 2